MDSQKAKIPLQMKSISITSCNDETCNVGIPESDASGVGSSAGTRGQLDSFDAWSQWFHRSAPEPIRAGSASEFVGQHRIEAAPAPVDAPVLAAAKGSRNVRSTKISRREVGLPCQPRKRQTKSLEGRKPSTARRGKLVRLRTFDDWSNWFWRAEWPAAMA